MSPNSTVTRRTADALVFAAALALVLGLPLAWSLTSFEVFRDPKRAIALAGWGLLAALFTASGVGNRTPWHDVWWAPWLGVLAGAFLSAFLSPHPAHVLVTLAPLGLTALGWGAVRQLNATRRQRLYGAVILAGAVEAIVTVLFSSPELRPRSFALLDLSQSRFEWIGTLGNPGYVATFLVLPALLAASSALRASSKRWLFGAAALLMVSVIVCTQTLTALAATVVGATVLLWRRLPRPRRVPALAAAAAVLIVVVVATPLRNRVVEVASLPHTGWKAFASWRGASSATAISMLAAKPLAGIGFNLFESRSFEFQDEATLARRGRTLGLDTGFGEAHNDILQYAAETGVLGILAVLAGLGIAWRGRDRLDTSSEVDVLPLALAATVLLMTQFPLHLASIATQWAVVAALALPPLPSPPPSRRKSSSWIRLCLGLAAFAAITGIAAQRYLASQALQQGRVVSEALRLRADPGTRIALAQRALEEVEIRLVWLPFSWRGRLVAGNLAMDAGRPTTAARHFAKAVDFSRRPELYYDLGLARLASGERASGLDNLVTAIKMNPEFLKQIQDRSLAGVLRARLDSDGYGLRYPWIYTATLAEEAAEKMPIGRPAPRADEGGAPPR